LLWRQIVEERVCPLANEQLQCQAYPLIAP
jgi:hypothetical protein